MKGTVTVNFLLKLLLPLTATVLALLAGEGIVRLIRPDLGWRLHEDPRLGWVSEEYRSFDPAAATDPTPGRTRVLFLGDSFLAGAGLDRLDERFPVVAGREDPELEVQVLASGGWGTDQELLAYLEKGRPWHPDVVVLCFCPNNDISNDVSNSHGDRRMMKPYTVLGPDGDLTLHHWDGTPMAWPDGGGIVHAPPFKSELLDWVRLVLHRRGASPPPATPGADPRYVTFLRTPEPPGAIYQLADSLDWAPQSIVCHVSAYIHEDFPLNRYQWDLFAALLERLRRETAADGARLEVLLLPASFRPGDPDFVAGGPATAVFQTPDGPFTFRAAEPLERLRTICARDDIRFCDPTAAFRHTIVSEGLAPACWPDPADRHFSRVGHRVLAEEFVAWWDSL